MGGGAVNGRGRLALAILGAAALGAVALVRLGPSPEPRVREPVRPAVEFAVVRLETVRVEISSEGAVAPRNRTVIQAAVGGRVGWVAGELVAGAEFAAGEALVRIEREPWERALLQAESALAQAALRVARAEAEREVAEAEWTDAAPDPLALGIPQLEEARAAEAAARGAVAQARRDLERTEVAAPFDLRVVRRLVEPSQVVAPGTPLAEAYGTEVFEVRLPLAEADLAFLEMDARPRVTVSAPFAGSREGRIVRAAPEIDPVTRLVTVIAEIRSPLTPGLFVSARIEGPEFEGVARLPRTALRDGRVLVVDDGDRLRFREVSVLRDRGGDEVLIGGGLAAGERVAVTPPRVVADGMSVRPVGQRQ